ncbi:hypothetical protein PYCC9005_000106 [Savitreella phatthalungensis]
MDDRLAVFAEFKGPCVALSAVALRSPNDAGPSLEKVLEVAQRTDPKRVDGNVGNYIFFPVKSLLPFTVREHVRATAFQLIGWLVQTGWFAAEDPEMCHQLLVLITSSINKAESEALRLALSKAALELFRRIRSLLNTLKSRPTIAMLVTELLKPGQDIELTTAGFAAVIELNRHLEPEAAASFLPGTVSSVTAQLLKPGVKTRVAVTGVDVLTSSITRSLEGELGGTDTYRNDKWVATSKEHLEKALRPILLKLGRPGREELNVAGVSLVKKLLETPLDGDVLVEYLAQHDPTAIPDAQLDRLAAVLARYLETFEAVLVGVDEDKKTQLLMTLRRSLPRVDELSRDLVQTQIIELLQSTLHILPKQSAVMVINDDKLHEPDFENISARTRDEIQDLLATCRSTTPLPTSTPESFWLAQKLGQDVVQDALGMLSRGDGIGENAIVAAASARGEDFRYELMHVLYPLLAAERPSAFVFAELARHCGYANTQAMLVDNADYITNGLTLAFHTLNITPHTPRILGLIAHMAPEIVPMLDDVVDVFFDVLDNHSHFPQLVDGIFFGLAGVVSAVKSKQVPRAFEEGMKAIEDTSRSGGDEAKGNDDGEGLEKPMDPSFKMVLRIAEKAQLFLSYGDYQILQNVMRLLADAIPVIATDENKYLPLVHLYWPQVVKRSDSDNPFLAAAAFGLMSKTVDFAGSFMRMRIEDDVLPRLEDVVRPQKDKRGNYIKRQRHWEGAGRREVAGAIEKLLKSVYENAGLRDERLDRAVRLIEDLAPRSKILSRLLEHHAAKDDIPGE